MYVKTFRYRVLASQEGRFRDIQRRVAEIYERQLGQDAIYLQSTRDPLEWTEIHIYPDEATAEDVANRLNALPAAAELWREFQATLDAGFPAVIESYEQQHWLDDAVSGDGHANESP